MAKYALIFKHAKGAKNPMMYEVVEYQNKKLAKEDIKLNGFVAVTVLSMDDLKSLMSLDFSNLDNKVKLCKTFGMTFNDDNYERATQFLFDVLAYDSTIFIETSDTCKEIKEELNQNGVIITDSEKEGAYVYYRVQNEQNGEYFSLTYNQILQTIETGVHGIYEELPLKDFFHKLATRTQEETQAPQEETQEETLCPLTTMELIENSLELIHNYGVNLESCLELPNGVFISRCNDSSILSCGNENYIFHFNVYTGELYAMYNAQTSETEKWGNEPQKAYHDIKKVIESEYKQFYDEQTQKEFDKLLKPYTQAFETYKNCYKEETKKRMIETLKTHQKVVLIAKKNGLINKTYNVNMFINSMKETCKNIQKEIVLNKKSHDDFIESRIIFLSLETLHKYYENESCGFGLITSEIKNIIESVAI